MARKRSTAIPPCQYDRSYRLLRGPGRWSVFAQFLMRMSVGRANPEATAAFGDAEGQDGSNTWSRCRFRNCASAHERTPLLAQHIGVNI